MKKLSTLFAGVALTLFASSAFADDLNPPPWRGQPGSTFQQWEFLTSETLTYADVDGNPYNGTPYALIVIRQDNPSHGWDPGAAPREGIWSLSGLMLFYVPNSPDPNRWKDVWVQVTWRPTDGGLGEPIPYLTDDQGGPHDLLLQGVAPIDGVWNLSTYTARIPFNPMYEIVGLRGDIDVDQVVIDTWCIPEPQTYALLAGLGLLGFGVWRRLNG
jgi:hypothetical protein